MPGCLLIHIGIDLFREGLIDTIGGFDLAEYSIVVGLAVIMTVWGMTAGLCVGVVLAAVAYLVQSVSYVSPVRRSSHCSALRSTKLRSRRAARLLPALLRRVFWLQLQGSLFFGNSQTISQELSKALEAAKSEPWTDDSTEDKPLVVIADFTLVLGIDSSAVDSIKALAKVCAQHGCACVYVRGSPAGFPTFSNLSDSLRLQASLQQQRRGQRRRTSSNSSGGGDKDFEAGSDGSSHGGDGEVGGLIFVVDDLDSALSLAEDLLLASQTDLATDPKELKFQEFLNNSPVHLVQLLHFAPNPRLVGSLMSHFSERTVRAGDVLWRQGDKSESCVLLRQGKLRALTAFNGKAETELQLTPPKGSSQEYVFEDILVGHLVGEFGLLKNDERTGALMAIDDSIILELSWPAFYAMQDEEKLLLHGICLQYLDLRTRRVGNFVTSAQSLPV
jgi:SulP family sulfate permease